METNEPTERTTTVKRLLASLSGLNRTSSPDDATLERLDVMLSDTFGVWLACGLAGIATTAVLGWAKAYTAASWTAFAGACAFLLMFLAMVHAKFLDRLFPRAQDERQRAFAWRMARPRLVEIPLAIATVGVIQLATGFFDLTVGN